MTDYRMQRLRIEGKAKDAKTMHCYQQWLDTLGKTAKQKTTWTLDH